MRHCTTIIVDALLKSLVQIVKSMVKNIPKQKCIVITTKIPNEIDEIGKALLFYGVQIILESHYCPLLSQI